MFFLDKINLLKFSSHFYKLFSKKLFPLFGSSLLSIFFCCRYFSSCLFRSNKFSKGITHTQQQQQQYPFLNDPIQECIISFIPSKNINWICLSLNREPTSALCVTYCVSLRRKNRYKPRGNHVKNDFLIWCSKL